MKKIVILSALLVLACGQPDKQAQLQELESQHAELTRKIEELKSEIIASGDNNQELKKVYVEIKQVQPEMFQHFIKIQGTIESDNNIFVPVQSPGTVRKIFVTEGQKVQKGQLLAELDGSILEHSLEELKINLELAKTVFERQERLWNKKIGSEVQYLQAKTTKESLENRLEALNEQYKLTKFISPLTGTVDQIQIKEGEAAAPGFGGIRVVQLSDLKISAVLSENYMGHIKAGDPVEIEIPVINKKINGKIRAVSQVIDSKNRTFSIEIKLPSSESDMKPNMLAVIKINDYTNPNSISVPLNIVQKTGENNFIFTAEKKESGDNSTWLVSKKIVHSGLYYDDKIEITKGLSSGEYIVVFGYQNLADNQTVHVSSETMEQ